MASVAGVEDIVRVWKIVEIGGTRERLRGDWLLGTVRSGTLRARGALTSVAEELVEGLSGGL